ncbi:MAG: NADPH-dependent FMN reductase, partial [Pseudolabrys sp.]
MAKIRVRKGMPSVQLDKAEFTRRFLARFYDPDFEPLQAEIDKIAETAWVTYDEYRKSPRVTKAGPGFADPDYKISVEWLATRADIRTAERRQKNRKS